jgi:hypothetical protein
MYVRTLENPGLGRAPFGQQGFLIPTFSSSVIRYKDNDADDKARPTLCSVYLPRALKYQSEIDLLVFFHGHDTCMKHFFDPAKVVKNFRLDDQVENANRKVALAVPSVFWRHDGHPNGSDPKNIRAAWSAAYLNAFVEEALREIGKWSNARRSLRRLILAGHSRAFDILTPLADQFDLGVPETRNGALAKLDKVLAMDTTQGLQHAKALEKWARQLKANPKPVQFILVLSKRDPARAVWENWEKTRERTTGHVAPPSNLDVQTKLEDNHCALPGKYIESLL